MNKLISLTCISFMLLVGCYSPSPTTDDVAHPVTIPPKTKNNTPLASFSQESLIALLTAEFAEHRGQLDLAFKNYIAQANQTKDPQVIAKAYEMASDLNDDQTQLAMAKLWVKAAPNDVAANRAAALQLSKNNKGTEALPYFNKLLQQPTEDLNFLNLTRQHINKTARDHLLTSLTNLLSSHPNHPKILYSKAILLAENQDFSTALKTLNQLPDAQQHQLKIILLKVLFLENTGNAKQALALLHKETTLNPQDKELRLNYAQQLISQGQLKQAKTQYATLIKQYPTDENLHLSYALICMESKSWEEAITHLHYVIDEGYNADIIYFYLGLAYKESGNATLALQNYKKVTEGDNYLKAIINSAHIYFEQNQITEAQQLLTEARQKQPGENIPLYLFEVDQLLKLDQDTTAWQLINEALSANPEDTNLLYSRALVAEKRNDLKQVEQDLHTVIKQEPKNASALNALGYILADRTTRYDEALSLIQTALKITPNDPATLDSLGWVYYRLGDLEQAVRYLQQAYTHYNDPDVAAHYGEVLWKQKKQTQAKAIWKKALTTAPNHTNLQQTILRLTGKKEL